MSEETKIQWATSTWNPWIGCDKVSPGCKNCYIVDTTPFRVRDLKHGDPRQRLSENYWKQPSRWNKAAGKNGNGDGPSPIRPRVFPSLCDWLDDQVPIEWLADFLKVIHDTPHLDWLLLTKRPENWLSRISDALIVANGGNPKDEDWFAQHGDQFPANDFADWLNEWTGGNAPANVWFGVSAENQEWFDKRVVELLKIPAKVRFVSAEPLLGTIDFGLWLKAEFGRLDESFKLVEPHQKKIHWVIVGGESGPGARPCSVEWIWDVRMQCKDAGVACFVKQLGTVPITENANIFDWPEHVQFYAIDNPGVASARVGLKHPKGGDSAEWPDELRVREFPR